MSFTTFKGLCKICLNECKSAGTTIRCPSFKRDFAKQLSDVIVRE